MSEYIQHVGRRTELRQKLIGLEIKVNSHRESLRLALDPLARPADLDAEKIITLAAALADRVVDVREAEAQIKAINNIIGE